MRMSKARAQARPIFLHVVVCRVRHLHVIVLFMSHSILLTFVSSACTRLSRSSTCEHTVWRLSCWSSFVTGGGSCVTVSVQMDSLSFVALFIFIDWCKWCKVDLLYQWRCSSCIRGVCKNVFHCMHKEARNMWFWLQCQRQAYVRRCHSTCTIRYLNGTEWGIC